MSEAVLDISQLEIEPASAREQELMKVTEAFFDLSVPTTALAQAIQELQQLQEETLAALSKERKHYDEDLSSALEAVAPVFGKMEAYTEKAARMAKQMQSITARVNKLKARASSIQMNAHKQAAKKK